MRNALKEDIQNVETEILKKAYMRNYMRKKIKCNTHQRHLKYVQRKTSVITCDWK